MEVRETYGGKTRKNSPKKTKVATDRLTLSKKKKLQMKEFCKQLDEAVRKFQQNQPVSLPTVWKTNLASIFFGSRHIFFFLIMIAFSMGVFQNEAHIFSAVRMQYTVTTKAPHITNNAFQQLSLKFPQGPPPEKSPTEAHFNSLAFLLR